MNRKYKILSKLKKEFPEFEFNLHSEDEYEDEMPYMEFGQLNIFIEKIFNKYVPNQSNDYNILIYKFFKFLNSLFDIKDSVITNFIHVNTLEIIIGVKYGYHIAKKYMSKEMYNYFIQKFPYEQYKDSWDTSNYYTEEEYQRILDLPDVGNDDVDL